MVTAADVPQFYIYLHTLSFSVFTYNISHSWAYSLHVECMQRIQTHTTDTHHKRISILLVVGCGVAPQLLPVVADLVVEHMEVEMEQERSRGQGH